MPQPINDESHNFVYNITPDGNTLMMGPIVDNYGEIESPISFSYRTPDGWSNPISTNIKDYYNDNKFSEFYLAPNRKILIMTVQREDSYGDNDIYVSFLGSDKKWSKPKNLGSDINTCNIEASPFLAADGKTIFFSSKMTHGQNGLSLKI